MHPIATIGYEKAPLAEILGRLQAAHVELLIDVRAVAASRRPGVSKTLLAGSLADAGVEYLHLRDLGTPKSGREAARAGRTDEMRAIFADHLETAPAQFALARATELVRAQRACLLCYESDPACCHRTIVADRLSQTTGVEILHL